MEQDFARNDYRGTAPWYTAPLYFLSCVVMCYALLWLINTFVETGDCWAMADSAGCMVVWRGEP